MTDNNIPKNKMKILLIDPPFYRLFSYYNRYFPIGLGYLCSTLRNEGHTTEIYNGDFNVKPTKMNYSRIPDHYGTYIDALKNEEHPAFKEIIDVVREFNPDIAGITAMTPKIASAFKTASIIKKENPHIKVIFGGNHPTVRPVEVMENSTNVDGLVIGEGEKSFKKLVDAISEGKNPEGIDGVAFRFNNFPIHGNPAPLIENLDEIPFPARDFYKTVSGTSEDMGMILTSRGCPYGCYYCSAKTIWGKKIRFRSIDNVMNEIDYISKKYKC